MEGAPGSARRRRRRMLQRPLRRRARFSDRRARWPPRPARGARATPAAHRNINL